MDDDKRLIDLPEEILLIIAGYLSLRDCIFLHHVHKLLNEIFPQIMIMKYKGKYSLLKIDTMQLPMAKFHHLVKFCISNLSEFRFDVYNNKFHNNYLFKVLFKALEENTSSLKIFTFSGMYKWELGNEMVSKYNETYQVLTLKALAYVRLSRALKTNQSLIILDLYNNSISDQVAMLIASALEINKTLTTLSFHCNSIQDEGIIAIAKVLETNTTLTNLDLANNNFSPDGFFALATSLKINTTLKKLNLINNGYLNTWYKGASIIKEILKRRKIKILGAKW